MTPADILNRPMPKSPTCVDCNSPATVVDRPMPLCDLHARILLCPDVKLELCLACLMSYDSDAFDRCPNQDCAINAYEDEMDRANDPEYYDFDGPEPEDDEPWLPNGESI